VQSTPHAIRSIVVADPRYTFVKADWRAMHLRLLANLSLDPQLIGLFDCGLDPFVSLASMLFGHGAEEVTDSERSVAKASTYALLYGGTCHTIAQKNNLTLEAIKAYKDTFFQRFRGVDRWIERTVRNARNDGFITTVNGRQLSPMGHGEGQLKKGTTVNRILQGSEADILTEVIAKVAASFKQGGGVIAFPVHDEILTQARDGWVESTIDDLTYFMTEVGHDFVVPMAVKVMAGPNWGDLHEQPTSEWWKPCA